MPQTCNLDEIPKNINEENSTRNFQVQSEREWTLELIDAFIMINNCQEFIPYLFASADWGTSGLLCSIYILQRFLAMIFDPSVESHSKFSKKPSTIAGHEAFIIFQQINCCGDVFEDIQK